MYNFETLPQWFWVIYYSFILLTIGGAIYSIKLKRHVWVPLFTILVALSIPVVGIINGIETRMENQDELEQWIFHLKHGSSWAYYLLFGYLYLCGWWVSMVRSNRRKVTGSI
ncbi:hypothetical protein LCM10_12325 [Rossellomorea aquimaris]|uniref:hypothetical protein n=1 Tax=Rossellomorea aquimaris TaxID=189382 RepID=UPI001CD6E03D|nr:hypothetical protein [Rossellomorea aquimaris]MCA1055774.1 hypothetical protein [Rossellomorea aquimaris]